jgi:hypothetical protein
MFEKASRMPMTHFLLPILFLEGMGYRAEGPRIRPAAVAEELQMKAKLREHISKAPNRIETTNQNF